TRADRIYPTGLADARPLAVRPSGDQTCHLFAAQAGAIVWQLPARSMAASASVPVPRREIRHRPGTGSPGALLRESNLTVVALACWRPQSRTRTGVGSAAGHHRIRPPAPGS